jgi:hypothetical protein
VELAPAVNVDKELIHVEENADLLSIAQVPVATCAAPIELFSEQADSNGLYTTAAQFTLAVHLLIH